MKLLILILAVAAAAQSLQHDRGGPVVRESDSDFKDEIQAAVRAGEVRSRSKRNPPPTRPPSFTSERFENKHVITRAELTPLSFLTTKEKKSFLSNLATQRARNAYTLPREDGVSMELPDQYSLIYMTPNDRNALRQEFNEQTFEQKHDGTFKPKAFNTQHQFNILQFELNSNNGKYTYKGKDENVNLHLATDNSGNINHYGGAFKCQRRRPARDTFSNHHGSTCRWLFRNPEPNDPITVPERGGRNQGGDRNQGTGGTHSVRRTCPRGRRWMAGRCRRIGNRQSHTGSRRGHSG